MEKPCMPEAGLLDEPLQAMQDRLHQLLAEWPENPILTQLLVLCQRLTGKTPRCDYPVLLMFVLLSSIVGQALA